MYLGLTAFATIPVLIFIASAGFVFYVLFGYPLLLGILAHRFDRLVVRKPVRVPISILIGVHNGEAFLEEKLRSVLGLHYPRELMEVLVISDGSTDRTDAIAQRMETDGVRLIRIPRGGKPAALNTGMQAASGEILVFTDVRQLLHPDSVGLLLESFADPSVGVVSGALVILDPATHAEANTGLYWRYEFWMRDRLSRLDSIFGATGALYAVRRELAVSIPADMLLDDMYLPLAAFFRGYRLIVDPRARMYDFPTGLETEFHRKVRTLAGNYQILKEYPQLLLATNRLWIHFLSYKFARLLLPFALILIAATSWFLPPPWQVLAIASQALFYIFAATDAWVPDRWPLKRLSSVARTFVALMGASLCALSIFFVPAVKLWKETKVAGKS